MAYKTFGDLRTQVKTELDLENEEFIQPTELTEYFNSGIRIIEAELSKLGLRDKYLETEAFINIVGGQSDYDLPTDIIDVKIRKLIYRNGPVIFTLRPLKGEKGYESEDVFNQYPATESSYYIIYKVGTAFKIRLVPKPAQSVTNGLRIVYLKDLNRYTADNVDCDVPEICYEYLLSYVRMRCYQKEGHVNMTSESEMLSQLLLLMRETLHNQVADPEMDLIDQDLSHYEEHS